METLNTQLQPFFAWLLRTTMQASLLICLILLIQAMLRGKLGIRWYYSLWLLLLVRMILPWSPESRVSLYNVIPQKVPQRQMEDIRLSTNEKNVSTNVSSSSMAEPKPAPSTTAAKETPLPESKNEIEPMSDSTTPVISETQNAVTTEPVAILKDNDHIDLSEIAGVLPLVWLMGALVLVIYIGASNFNLWRIVRRRRPLTDQKILDLLEDCKDQMGIQTILGIVPTEKVKSPALFGFVRPRLLLPQEMIENLSQQELRYVLLHELAHLKRHDIYIGWLMSILQILHWFNPLIWLAFYHMRADRELACDALVLSHTQSGEPKSYGQIIVGLLERFSQAQRLPAMAGILESKSQLKRRITMIAKYKKKSYQWSPFAVASILILACISLPDALSTKVSEASTTKTGANITLRQVWSGPDADAYGTVSSDGRYLSCNDWKTGDLAIRELATGKTRLLTGTKKGGQEGFRYALYSAISPDGKMIAYSWTNQYDTYDLCVIGTDGSGDRTLYSSKDHVLYPVCWSSDGTRIAARRGGGGRTDIVSVLVEDGSIQVLKASEKPFWPQVCYSPDDRFIAYDFPVAKDGDNYDISLIRTDGSGEIPLVTHPASDRLLGWVPNREEILFLSDREGTQDIWVIKVVDGKPQGSPRLIMRDVGQISPQGLTHNGSLFFSKYTRQFTTEVIPFDKKTGKIQDESKKPLLGSNFGVEWSPDGQYLSYVEEQTEPEGPGYRYHWPLHIRNIKTGEDRILAANLNVRAPHWSPDGRSILVTGFDTNRVHQKGYRGGIYKIDVQDDQVTQLIQFPPERRVGWNQATAEWSLDGKAIFYRAPSGIIRRELDSGREEKFYQSSALGRALKLSPDDKTLAFCESTPDLKSTRIMTIPVSGGEPTELCRFKEPKGGLQVPDTITWTPDGNYLLFGKKERKGGSICRVFYGGGEPEVIWKLENRITNLSMHPNGEEIAVSTYLQEESIWAMENFLPEELVARPDSQVTLRQVWSSTYPVTDGEPSPDGRYLSYTDWETGDLAIYEIATGTKRRLTNKGTWDDSDECVYSSVWSPDSRQIVYAWELREQGSGYMELRVIGLDGSEPRTLYTNKETEWARVYDWSPDNKQILTCMLGKDGTGSISLVSASDGSVRVLKTAGKYSDWPRNMSFSPDGNKIVYSDPQKEDSKNHDISVISTDGDNEIPLVEHPADDFVLGWAPDGKNILFASNRTGSVGIWLIAVEDGKPQGSPRMIQSAGDGFEPLGFTDEGSFYYGTSRGSDDIFVATLDQKTGKIITPLKKAVQRYEGSLLVAVYSHDGKFLAYIYSDSHRNMLCIRSLETGKEREFPLNLNNIRRYSSPRWSPDGSSIIVSADDVNETGIDNAGIYNIDIQTGDIKYLVRTHTCEWSADGKSVFYPRNNRNIKTTQIIARDLKTGQERLLCQPPLDRFVFNIALSPDGQWLALRCIGPTSLYVLPASGGQARELPEFEKVASIHKPIAWTADSKYILFSGNEPGGGKNPLYRISLETGKTEKLGVQMNRYYGLSAHPDGRHILISGRENAPESEVWVMVNFLPETPVTESEPVPTLRQIEVKGRGSVHSRPSFDGRYMAVVKRDRKAGTDNLVIRELDTGKERILVENSDPNRFVYNSRISRDSRKIAFYQYNPEKEDFDLRIIGLDGSNLRTLLGAEIAGYFNIHAWSPDGKYIFGMLMKKPVQLARLSTDDGSLEVLKTFEQGRVSRIDASPDGRYLAYSYVEQRTSNADIFVFDLERNQEAPLVKHSANDKLLGWTPDGRDIFFTSDRNGTWDGWLQRVVDGKPIGLPEMIKAGIGDVGPIGFTQSGSFYYAFSHQAWNVYTAKLDRNTGQVVSEPVPVRLVGKDFRPDFSPDGRYLAYLSQPERNRPQIIRLRTLATGQEREIKPDLPRFDRLRWCPDSRHLLLTSFDRNSPSMICKLDVDNGSYTTIVKREQQSITQAELSSDGKILVYRIGGPGYTPLLMIRNMETGNERELLHIEGAQLAFWSLSPDGKQVACSIRKGEAGTPFVLKIMSVETGESWTLVEDMGFFPVWSIDGRDIFFTRLNELWRVSATGSEPQKLLEWKEMIMFPRIHPDGQHIAFHSGGYVSEMWVMENFLPTAVASAGN